jgi:FdhE protein
VPAAAGLLDFYARVAEFQAEIHTLEPARGGHPLFGPLGSTPTRSNDAAGTQGPFAALLRMVADAGPKPLADCARSLQARGVAASQELLDRYWAGSSAPVETEPATFLAWAFLQPCAERIREQQAGEWAGYAGANCPFCGRKAGVGVLRPMGDGAKRSLLCCFCLTEWNFRRLVCVACGEENDKRLPVYTADEFPHVRVECCDTCKRYLKAVDLTRNGLADPVVDEIASVALDLWAQPHGYAKWQVNLLGL